MFDRTYPFKKCFGFWALEVFVCEQRLPLWQIIRQCTNCVRSELLGGFFKRNRSLGGRSSADQFEASRKGGERKVVSRGRFLMTIVFNLFFVVQLQLRESFVLCFSWTIICSNIIYHIICSCEIQPNNLSSWWHMYSRLLNFVILLKKILFASRISLRRSWSFCCEFIVFNIFLQEAYTQQRDTSLKNSCRGKGFSDILRENPTAFNLQIRLLPEIIRFWEPQPYFPSRGQRSYGLVEFVSRTCLWRLVKNLLRSSEFSEFPCNSVHFADNFFPSFPNLG